MGRRIVRTAVCRQAVCLVLVGTWIALPVPAALAQDAEPTPSGSELRQDYPLREATPEPVAASPTSARTAEPAPAAESSGGRLRPVLVIALILVAFAIGFTLGLRPLRARLRGGPPAATAAVPETANGRDPPRAPVTRRRWTAEIEWQPEEGESRFRVIAEDADAAVRVVLDESSAGQWPPAGAASVHDMRAAADELEARLIAAGWRPLPPGKAWYAKRFAWEPPARSNRFRSKTEPTATHSSRGR